MAEQHALFFPLPLQGHITPQMLLAKLLAASGFKITLVTTETVHSRMQQAHPGPPYKDLDITVVAIPDGLAPEDRLGPHAHFKLFGAIEKMGGALEKLLGDLQKQQPPVTCIVSDVFCSVTQEVADKFGIPRSSFFVSNATVFGIHLHAPSLLAQGILPAKGVKGKSPEVITSIPGLTSLPFNYLPGEMLMGDVSNFLFQFLLRQFEIARRSAWAFTNSFEELESEAVKAIRKDIPFLTVGPLLLPEILEADKAASTKGGADLWTVDESCLKWLDNQAPSSVIYVSFGSLAVLSKEDIHQLGLGLEASGQPFLWAIRPSPDSTLETTLPEGFQERTKNQGLVMNWAPQVKVLQHASVGGFLTHCGWNSAIEGISFGVPMLGLPCFAEQTTTCWLLENEWGVGMEVKARGEGGKVSKEEVANGIVDLLKGEKGKAARKKVVEWKEMATKAVQAGGSSHKNLKLFIEDMKNRAEAKAKATAKGWEFAEGKAGSNSIE